jgi:hypothetical protein
VRHVVVVVLALVVSVTLAGPALAVVRKTAITSPVRAGNYASLTVRVSPKARCTIKVVYGKVVSKARGLGPKKGRVLTWRWRVGALTRPGLWPVVVTCGKSGSLKTKMRVFDYFAM